MKCRSCSRVAMKRTFAALYVSHTGMTTNSKVYIATRIGRDRKWASQSISNAHENGDPLTIVAALVAFIVTSTAHKT